jgi:DNA polymerase-3 subunit epsilon
VRDGRREDEQHWLMRPPSRVDYFEPFNVSLHGIDSNAVSGAPGYGEILGPLVRYIGSDPVVAHNAAFDVGVVRDACVIEGLACPDLTFLCTLVMSRRALKLPSYSLPFVAEALGFGIDGHHHALSDARVVVDIVAALAERVQADNLNALAASLGVRLGRVVGSSYEGSVSLRSGARQRSLGCPTTRAQTQTATCSDA